MRAFQRSERFKWNRRGGHRGGRRGGGGGGGGDRGPLDRWNRVVSEAGESGNIASSLYFVGYIAV